MKLQKTLLNIDLAIQMILLILTIMTGMASIMDGGAVIVLALMLLLLGIWQLLSGIVLGLLRNDKKRGTYLLSSISYLLLLAMGTSIVSTMNFGGSFEVLLIAIFVLIIPLAISVWYYLYSQKDKKILQKEMEGMLPPSKKLDDILDTDEILKQKIKL